MHARSSFLLSTRLGEKRIDDAAGQFDSDVVRLTPAVHGQVWLSDSNPS